MGDSLYTAVFIVCMVTPLLQDMTGKMGNCLYPAKPEAFPTEFLCHNHLNRIHRRLSTRQGQTELLNLGLLPMFTDGRLKVKEKCERVKYEGYLQCTDCES